MKKLLLSLSVLIAALVLPSVLVAQDWVSQMQDPSVNFLKVQKTFYNYYDKKERQMEREMKKAQRKNSGSAIEEENEFEVPGYSQFKRWEWFMTPRVAANGDRFDPATTWRESVKYRQQYSTLNAGNWTFIGPSTTPNLAGAGRLNFVRVDPNNSNNIFVGSPGGGLWKSTDAGLTWSTNTDHLPHVIGCTDLAINPNNSDIMYLATGDGDGGDTYTIGLLKTIDGGITWNTTGLSFNVANFRQMSKVLIDPTNTDVLLVASSGGIYRSNDAGVSFTMVQAGSFKDMEFKPMDPTTVYACGTEFYKSTNNGVNWTKVAAGLPVATNVSRMAIATSDADPAYLYMIVGLPAPNYGTEGFYKSTNSGATFSKISTPTTLGTQQWYDLAIASSPANRDEIVIGGQTSFIRSVNGGVSWASNGGGTHVDYHDVIYTSATSYYLTSDGGIYHTTNSGGAWTKLNSNLQISEMYGFGQSATNPNLLIQGWQDNGTNRYDGTNWSSILGGDGMLCFIDWNNDQNMWGEQYNGNLNRSTNGGASFSSANGAISEAGAWVTPWMQDPVNPSTIYVGMINVWKSTNGGVAWTKISNFTNTGTLNTFAISPANNQVIWATKASNLYLTTNGGASWTTISNVPTGTITGIACSNTDEFKAWITYSGFNNTAKVLQTNDQGISWINLSASVPNIPVNCITYMNNSNDAIYIGTDLGVFYKDNTLNVWQPFFNGLPNVQVTQLSIFYPGNKLRASTYGRGMWESDLYVAGSYAPTAAFGSNNKIACPGAAIQFSDYTAGQPNYWNWTFTGGTPSSSNLQNPLVYYNTPGSFPVSLTVSNANGSDSTTYNNFVNISSSPYSAPVTVGAKRCGAGPVNLSATGTGLGTLRWWDAPGGGNVVATGTTYSPTIGTTTTYYIDEDFPSGAQDYTGEGSNNFGTGAYFTANDIRGLYFDVLDPVILNSVDVYANSAGNRTIEIIDAQGNLFVDTTLFIAASPTVPQTITLNFVLYPGTNYFIKCRGFVDLYRNSAGAVYPYISSSVNITNSNAGSPGYYYFFYNWTYTSITCNTARTPCSAVDTCAIIGVESLTPENSLAIYPNPSNGLFSLNFNAGARSDYNIVVTNTLGEIVYEERLQGFSGKYLKEIDLTEFGKGVYLVNVSNAGNETVRKVMIY